MAPLGLPLLLGRQSPPEPGRGLTGCWAMAGPGCLGRDQRPSPPQTGAGPSLQVDETQLALIAASTSNPRSCCMTQLLLHSAGGQGASSWSPAMLPLCTGSASAGVTDRPMADSQPRRGSGGQACGADLVASRVPGTFATAVAQGLFRMAPQQEIIGAISTGRSAPCPQPGAPWPGARQSGW